jgi:pyridoxal phosphate enzyme (YggS family)
MEEMTEARMRENVDSIRERIDLAARRAGRRPEEVTLVGVSKFQPLKALYVALDCGITIFGENRVQEREQKAAAWSREEVSWHMVGHLQRNKARKAVELFDCIESVDSFELASVIDEAVKKRMALGLKETPYPVMIEVNTSGEESKNGTKPHETLGVAEKIMNESSCIRIAGFMTIGPLAGGELKTREAFALLRSLAEEAGEKLGLRGGRLSMGMSGDFEIAIEEGSSLVRVGTGIFGTRHG